MAIQFFFILLSYLHKIQPTLYAVRSNTKKFVVIKLNFGGNQPALIAIHFQG